MTAKTIAILGAGPTGIEAALHAAHRGYDVHVYEMDTVGAHVRRWGHVTLFSPWGLNRSQLGEAMLREAGATLPDADAFPTGASYLSEYLEPLATHPLLAGRVHSGTEVLGVSRHDALKGQFVGGRSTDNVGAFWLHLRAEQGERFERADLVIDATGAYRTANALGPGGLPARGESALTDDHLTRYIPDVLGADEVRYAGKRTLVVGAGYSAITSLKTLHELKARHPGTQLTWLTWQAEAPYEVLEDDVLPQRKELAIFGNRAAAGHVDGVTPLPGAWITSFYVHDTGAIEVTLERPEGPQTIVVDQLVSNIGYKPDTGLFRELQVHQCYASEGPMKLAASLLASGGGGDCLAQTSAGVETLLNPERGFFVLGSKSYGRNSSYLLRLGVEQIQEIFDHLATQG